MLRLLFIFTLSTLFIAPDATAAPKNMKWIPEGEFLMGTNEQKSLLNERPANKIKLKGFWMDEFVVSNSDFGQFVKSKKYKTTAERPIDWEELKKQVPPGTEKPADDVLVPGSLVFVPPNGPVDLGELGNWWQWTPGASWDHPQGPGSSIADKSNYPVTQVSWDDANEYCKWANKRLPTEAEWEFASRGGSKANTRFWWGEEFRPKGKWMANTFTGEFPYKNTAEDGFERTSPVNAFEPNGYGLYDMAGNVWQWTADFYREDTHQLLADELKTSGASCHTDPTGPKGTFNPARPVVESPERVIKGGSFLCNVTYCESYRPTARRGTPPDTSSEHVGFRCAKD